MAYNNITFGRVCLTIVYTTSLISGVILHASGIYILTKLRNFRQNQRLILLHMSTIEILLLILRAVFLTVVVHDLKMFPREIYMIILMYLGLPWATILLFLTVDRFLEIYLHLRYLQVVTLHRTKIVLVLQWVFGIGGTAVAIIARTVLKFNVIAFSYYYLSVIVLSLILLTYVIVYGYIYTKIRTTRERRRTMSANYHQEQMKRSHFIPMWIMVSFVIFYMVPQVVIIIKFSQDGAPKNDELLMPTMATVMIIGYTMDAFVYIFCNRNIRRKFFQMCKSVLSSNKRRGSNKPIKS